MEVTLNTCFRGVQPVGAVTSGHHGSLSVDGEIAFIVVMVVVIIIITITIIVISNSNNMTLPPLSLPTTVDDIYPKPYRLHACCCC